MLNPASEEVGSGSNQKNNSNEDNNNNSKSCVEQFGNSINKFLNNSNDESKENSANKSSNNLEDKSKEPEKGSLESATQNLASALLGESLVKENNTENSQNANDEKSPTSTQPNANNNNNGNSNIKEKGHSTSESDEEDASEHEVPNQIGEKNEDEKDANNLTSTIPLDDFESTQKVEPIDGDNEENKEDNKGSLSIIIKDNIDEVLDNFTGQKDEKENEPNNDQSSKQDESPKTNENDTNDTNSNKEEDPVKINIEISDNLESSNDQSKVNNSEKDESSTFATNPTKIDIKLTNGSLQSTNSVASGSSIPTSRSTNRSAYYCEEPSPRTKFKNLIYGDPAKKAQKALTRSYFNSLRNRSNGGNTQIDPAVIQSTADALLKGKPLKISDPNEVAEIIEDLNGRKIEALANDDYKTTKKIKDTIDSTRMQFRLNDRERLHKKVVAKLEERNKESIQELNSTKAKWKMNHQEHLQKNKDSLVDLQNRHQSEHEKLETDWTQPQILHQFDKRSPVLLDMKQREHYMMLAGMYSEADQMKRINRQMEKREIASRNFEMQHHFKLARSTLIRKQSEEVENVKMDLVVGDSIFRMKERREVDVKLRRLQATQRRLDDEKNMDNFVAKRYKRPKSSILPATVLISRDNCDDIPVKKRGTSSSNSNSTASQNAQDMMVIRKKNIVTPLPIQPLTIKKYKTQKIV